MLARLPRHPLIATVLVVAVVVLGVLTHRAAQDDAPDLPAGCISDEVEVCEDQRFAPG